MKYIYLLILVYSSSTAIFGQTTQTDYNALYTRAKSLFDEGKYGLAQEAFKPLLQKNEENIYVDYATFYFGLSAYRDGFPALARDSFLQLKRNNPQWPQIDEVNLWLVHLFFEQNELHKAIPVINTIKDPEILKKTELMKGYYLSAIDSITPLLSLHQQFPTDSMIGNFLALSIIDNPYPLQDRELLGQLIEDFHLDGTRFGIMPKDKMIFKDQYDIGILFPFLTERLQPNLAPKVNQFVIDMYQGMLLAADTLNKQGSKINLLSYDTKRDSATTVKILNYPEMEKVDLIIGPLYNSHLVNNFSVANMINVVHPLTENAELINDNPYLLLTAHSPIDIAHRASSYAVNKMRGKNGVIFYGTTKNDYTIAKAFADSVRLYGHNILKMTRVHNENMREILMTLVNSTTVNDIDTIVYKGFMDSIEYVFVSSQDKSGKIYANVLPGIEAREDTVEVFGSRNWIEDEIVDLNALERLNVKLCAPGYIDLTGPSYKKFQQQYILAYGTPPTKYAAMGYETLFFFGSMLQKYGRYFQSFLSREGFHPGLLSYGFDYSGARYNSAIPIIGIDRGKINIYENNINFELDNESK